MNYRTQDEPELLFFPPARQKSHLASIISSALFIIVAESTVIFGPYAKPDVLKPAQ